MTGAELFNPGTNQCWCQPSEQETTVIILHCHSSFFFQFPADDSSCGNLIHRPKKRQVKDTGIFILQRRAEIRQWIWRIKQKLPSIISSFALLAFFLFCSGNVTGQSLNNCKINIGMLPLKLSNISHHQWCFKQGGIGEKMKDNVKYNYLEVAASPCISCSKTQTDPPSSPSFPCFPQPPLQLQLNRCLFN